jgi:hypothetical protein
VRQGCADDLREVGEFERLCNVLEGP